MFFANRLNQAELVHWTDNALAAVDSCRDDSGLPWIHYQLRNVRLFARAAAKASADATAHQVLTIAEEAAAALDEGRISRIRECITNIRGTMNWPSVRPVPA